ncbi:hypothetical protein HMPREF1153_1105 [Selenomonas sp. CM52]|nr:hypothetical protein HMPREF1153_1105 [Selenomonas sp. CM52]
MFLAHCNPALSFCPNRLSLVYIIQLFCHFVLRKQEYRGNYFRCVHRRANAVSFILPSPRQAL